MKYTHIYTEHIQSSSYYKLHCFLLIWALKMGYSLSTYGVYDKGKKLITKEFAGILFSSSFTVNGGLKESACLALRVLNWPLWRPAENTGEARGKSTALLTHDQQACKGNSRGDQIYVRLPEWVTAEFRKQGDVALNLYFLLTIVLFCTRHYKSPGLTP